MKEPGIYIETNREIAYNNFLKSKTYELFLMDVLNESGLFNPHLTLMEGNQSCGEDDYKQGEKTYEATLICNRKVIGKISKDHEIFITEMMEWQNSGSVEGLIEALCRKLQKNKKNLILFDTIPRLAKFPVLCPVPKRTFDEICSSLEELLDEKYPDIEKQLDKIRPDMAYAGASIKVLPMCVEQQCAEKDESKRICNSDKSWILELGRSYWEQIIDEVFEEIPMLKNMFNNENGKLYIVNYNACGFFQVMEITNNGTRHRQVYDFNKDKFPFKFIEEIK